MMQSFLDWLWHTLWHRPLCACMGVRPRSGKWPAVRRAWLAEHPCCEVCGGADPDVHHVRPFHLHPSLELEPTNLISLGRDCGHHLTHGHCGSFLSYNAHCREDVTIWRVKYLDRP